MTPVGPALASCMRVLMRSIGCTTQVAAIPGAETTPTTHRQPRPQHQPPNNPTIRSTGARARRWRGIEKGHSDRVGRQRTVGQPIRECSREGAKKQPHPHPPCPSDPPPLPAAGTGKTLSSPPNPPSPPPSPLQPLRTVGPPPRHMEGYRASCRGRLVINDIPAATLPPLLPHPNVPLAPPKTNCR